jgi:hypothetical protein
MRNLSRGFLGPTAAGLLFAGGASATTAFDGRYVGQETAVNESAICQSFKTEAEINVVDGWVIYTHVNGSTNLRAEVDPTSGHFRVSGGIKGKPTVVQTIEGEIEGGLLKAKTWNAYCQLNITMRKVG